MSVGILSVFGDIFRGKIIFLGFPFHFELGLNWGVNYCKEDNFGQLVFMLFLAASIYYLWGKRNI